MVSLFLAGFAYDHIMDSSDSSQGSSDGMSGDGDVLTALQLLGQDSFEFPKTIESCIHVQNALISNP